MTYKRLEIYVWWTCNQKCTYCMEFPNMKKYWKKKVSKDEILKKLLKYKFLWYNHVTFLWWEPFIQLVFLDALKIAKKLGYTILVTTNCTTLHIEKQAEKFLPYIDELILSFEAIDILEQQIISRTKNYVHWEGVFKNISKYWKWTMLKSNIVITKDNLSLLPKNVEYLYNNWVSDISVTYPDIAFNYYWKQFVLDRIAPKYKECINYIYEIIEFSDKNNIKLKIVDFPFCIFDKEKINKIINLTDDYDYQERLKIVYNNSQIKHSNLKYNFSFLDKTINNLKYYLNKFNKNKDIIENKDLPRKRNHCYKCIKCKYNNICWWPSIYYENLYWLNEINYIK